MVLVTGGAGYIGSHTCVELLNNGIEIVVMDNFSNSKPIALERVKKITGKDFAIYDADCRNSDELDDICTRHNIDCIMHFAGLKAVAGSVSEPINYYENNINSTITLLRIMENYNIKKFIFSSSATVYSADNTMPLKEDSKIGNCTNPYGWTKFMIEQILIDTQKANPDWSVVLLRYANPIGAHESGLIGEDPTGVPANIFPYVAQVAIGKYNELPVTGDDYDTPDGTGVRDYLHVVDLADGHIAALKNMIPGLNIYNLGTGKGVSVLEIIHEFEKVTGQKVDYKIAPRRPGDLATTYLDPTRAKQILNWETKKTLADCCRDTWNWQKNNPGGFL